MQCYSSRLAASHDLMCKCYNNAVAEAPQQCVQPHGKMSCMSAPGCANRGKTMPSKVCLPNANQYCTVAQFEVAGGSATVELLTCLLALALPSLLQALGNVAMNTVPPSRHRWNRFNSFHFTPFRHFSFAFVALDMN